MDTNIYIYIYIHIYIYQNIAPANSSKRGSLRLAPIMCRYIASASARGRELSGRVRADAYNFAVLCSGPAPCV